MMVGGLLVQDSAWSREVMHLDVDADGPPVWENSSFAAADLWSNRAYGVAGSTQGGGGRLVVVGSFDGIRPTVFTARPLDSAQGEGTPACIRGTWWDATGVGGTGTCQACESENPGGGCPLGFRRVECSAAKTSVCETCPAPKASREAFLSPGSCSATQCPSGVPNAIRGSCVIGTPSLAEPPMLDVVQMQVRANHAAATVHQQDGFEPPSVPALRAALTSLSLSISYHIACMCHES